jgi:hypothetical protein
MNDIAENCRVGIKQQSITHSLTPYLSTCNGTKLREHFSAPFIINIIIQAFYVKVGSLVSVDSLRFVF